MVVSVSSWTCEGFIRGVESSDDCEGGVAVPSSEAVEIWTFGTVSLEDTEAKGVAGGELRDSSAVSKETKELARDSARGGRAESEASLNADGAVLSASRPGGGDLPRSDSVLSATALPLRVMIGGGGEGSEAPEVSSGTSSKVCPVLEEASCSCECSSSTAVSSAVAEVERSAEVPSSTSVVSASILDCDLDGATSSNSGGGCEGRSIRDVLAANAIASWPYGRPNRAKDSREAMSLICSGVGPDLGYVNSVRTSVCVRGDEMELTERVEGEFKWGESSRRDRERDMALNIEPEPDWDGRWFPARE